MSVAMRPLRVRAAQWLLRQARRRAASAKGVPVQGIWVRTWFAGDRKQRAALLKTVSQALALIDRYDPRRLARMRRDLASIVISPIVGAGSAGEYWRHSRTCGLNPWTVERTNAFVVAIVIIHEAAHARLRRFPVEGECIARIETLCRAQELAFADRLPDPEPFRNYLLSRDAARAALVMETPDDSQARAFAALRTYVPAWMAAVTERLTRWFWRSS